MMIGNKLGNAPETQAPVVWTGTWTVAVLAHGEDSGIEWAVVPARIRLGPGNALLAETQGPTGAWAPWIGGIGREPEPPISPMLHALWREQHPYSIRFVCPPEGQVVTLAGSAQRCVAPLPAERDHQDPLSGLITTAAMPEDEAIDDLLEELCLDGQPLEELGTRRAMEILTERDAFIHCSQMHWLLAEYDPMAWVDADGMVRWGLHLSSNAGGATCIMFYQQKATSLQ